ncbi:MAG: heterodisulfide reductase subunit E, partial [Dehalococcoidia bacterium]|nr:heterodisulfide reductase subunit E [Dehalococcoidia bacterium]
IGGIALMLGLTIVSLRRLFKREAAGRSMYFDWYFIGLLYVLTITGFALEIVRYAGLGDVAYSLYMGHLVFYFMLFTYLPFTKFAHIVYRTLALTHARQTGRLPASRLLALEHVQEPI